MEDCLFLKDSLNGEIAAYKELLLLSEQEKEAVIINDVKTVSSIVEKQQSLLNALKKIKSERDGRLCALWQEDEGGRGELGEELKHLFAQRESEANRLRAASALNKTLIDTQLQYTSFCVNLITGQGSVPGTYSGSGTIKDEGVPRSRMIDQTI